MMICLSVIWVSHVMTEMDMILIWVGMILHFNTMKPILKCLLVETL